MNDETKDKTTEDITPPLDTSNSTTPDTSKDNSDDPIGIKVLHLLAKGVEKGIDIAAKGVNIVVDKSKEFLRKKMKEGFKKVLIKSTIKYCIIFVGIFVVILEPFKFFFSHLTASILFLGVLIWSIINAIKTIKEYYKLPIFMIKTKSINNGAWEFIKYKWPGVAKGISSYSKIRKVGASVYKGFEQFPEVKSTVKEFLHYVLKDIIIFCSFFVLYFVSVQFIAKPLLLGNVAGLKTWEVYLFPFVQMKDFIVYLVQLL